MTFGMDTVAARGRNISVNGVAVPEGQPYLHNGEGGGRLCPLLPLILGSWVLIPSPSPSPSPPLSLCRAVPSHPLWCRQGSASRGWVTGWPWRVGWACG